MPFIDEQAQFLRNESVATQIFISTKVSIPTGPGPFLTLIELPGLGIERTQQGGYQRPSAMVVSRADTYESARGLILKAYGAYIDRTTGKLKVINRTIGQATVSVTSLVRSGSVATVTTTGQHRFVTGMTVTIEGADQSAYNGPQVITVSTPTVFTFAVSGSPATPATGTILAKFLGTFYQEIALGQEPYDLGLDANERARIAFNIMAVKNPS